MDHFWTTFGPVLAQFGPVLYEPGPLGPLLFQLKFILLHMHYKRCQRRKGVLVIA